MSSELAIIDLRTLMISEDAYKGAERLKASAEIDYVKSVVGPKIVALGAVPLTQLGSLGIIKR